MTAVTEEQLQALRDGGWEDLNRKFVHWPQWGRSYENGTKTVLQILSAIPWENTWNVCPGDDDIPRFTSFHTLEGALNMADMWKGDTPVASPSAPATAQADKFPSQMRR